MDIRRITHAVNCFYLNQQSTPVIHSVHQVNTSAMDVEDLFYDLDNNAGIQDVIDISLNFTQISFDILVEESLLNNFDIQPYDPTRLYDTCAICRLDYETEDTMIMTLECKHYYHLDCIKKWFDIRNTCPICRAKIQ